MSADNLNTKNSGVPNRLNDTIIAASSISNSFSTLVDLAPWSYTSIIIESSLNQDITIRFKYGEGYSELIVPINRIFVLDDFLHLGLVGIKFNGAAPDSGELKMVSW